MDFFKGLIDNAAKDPKKAIENVTNPVIDFGAGSIPADIPFISKLPVGDIIKGAINTGLSMSFLAPDAPTSQAGPPALIAKYDMVLGVAIDAINAQFKTLYNTEAPDQDQSLEPKDRQHLINWKFSLKAGSNDIKGYVYPPFIDITNLSASADKHRTVRLNFKFIPDLGSAFNEYTFEEDPKDPEKFIRKAKPTPLDNWTFSFEASIGSAEIREIMHKAVHPKIQKTLEHYVQSEEFTAASLFCLFESTQIANTFKLRDPNGKEPERDSVESNFMLVITKHFAALNDNPEKAGSNPWVLGYPIHQKPNRSVGQAEWAPKNFHMSTTPQGRTQFNYLLAIDGNNVSPATDGTAGILDTSFFTTVHSNDHDGILAMSSDLVQKKFVTEIVQPKFARKRVFADEIAKVDNPVVTGDTWSQHTSWETPWRYHDNVIKNKWNFKGTHDLTIRRWSSNIAKPDYVRGQDAHRIMYIDIFITYTVENNYETTTLGLDDWSEEWTATTTIPLHVRFSVVPGKDGVWIASQDAGHTQLPLVRNNKIVYHTGDTGEGVRVGVQYKGILKFTDFLGLNDFLGLTSAIGSDVGDIASMANLELDSNVLTGLRNKILMPAGDVFTFSGLDTDKDGNTYSHVDYNTISDGDNDANK